MADLRSPLLSGGGELSIAIEEPNGNHYPSAAENCDDDNPFEAVGATAGEDELRRRAPSTADPFRNATPGWGGPYEWAKTVVCLPLMLVRLVVFGVAMGVGFVVTKIALVGWKDTDNPMPRWRARLMWVTRICARIILFSFGYHYIKRKGKAAPREVAPIVVSNHISYIDPIFFFYELCPTIVASESHDSIPFVGTIIRAMQVIYVDRFSPASRRNAVNEIKRKASQNEFQRVLLFPEGTTTNGRYLISFQLGAFIPGLPVQPVVVRYPHVHFDQSWGLVSLAKLMLRMFFQIHNFMEVEYLPVITPLASRKENAIQFAERTGYAMACALNVVQTSYSYGDMLLLTRASELVKVECTQYMVEMAWAKSTFKISTSEALEFLEKFLAMNPDSSGRVTYSSFANVMGLGLNLLSEKIFCYLDIEKKGSITFRQFLLGSAFIRKQPLFLKACEEAFIAHSDSNEYISFKQFCDKIWLVTGPDDEVLGKLLFSYDSDDDGLIGRDDFMACLWNNPLLIAVFVASSSISNVLKNKG